MKANEQIVMRAVSIVCGVPPDKIVRKGRSSRRQDVVIARQMLCNLLFENYNYTYYQIRDVIGYKNHASSIHARNMHKQDISFNNSYRKSYSKILSKLNIAISSEKEIRDAYEDLKLEHEKANKLIEMLKDRLEAEEKSKDRYQQKLITLSKKYCLSYH
jgi:hypothetical protein